MVSNSKNWDYKAANYCECVDNDIYIFKCMQCDRKKGEKYPQGSSTCLIDRIEVTALHVDFLRVPFESNRDIMIIL